MLLAIDTATTTASLAVYDLGADQLLAETTWQARRRQTQDLIGAAQSLLVLLDVSPQALTALAVTTGPGSFTGVRIGISTVKGMGLGLPHAPRVVGIPTLSVTAAPLLALAASTQPATLVCAYIQAGRGRYNWCWFTAGDRLKRPSPEEHSAGTASELIAALGAQTDRTLWLVGETTPELQAAVPSLPQVTLLGAVEGLRRAGVLASLAAQQLAAGEEDSLETLQPLYLRNP